MEAQSTHDFVPFSDDDDDEEYNNGSHSSQVANESEIVATHGTTAKNNVVMMEVVAQGENAVENAPQLQTPQVAMDMNEKVSSSSKIVTQPSRPRPETNKSMQKKKKEEVVPSKTKVKKIAAEKKVPNKVSLSHSHPSFRFSNKPDSNRMNRTRISNRKLLQKQKDNIKNNLAATVKEEKSRVEPRKEKSKLSTEKISDEKIHLFQTIDPIKKTEKKIETEDASLCQKCCHQLSSLLQPKIKIALTALITGEECE